MRNIQDIFYDWATKKAKWYQIWLPDSGIAGGAIVGFILSWLVILIVT